MLFKNELGGDGVRYPFTSGHRQLWVRSPFEGQDPDPLNQDGSYPWESGGGNQDPDGLLLEEARVEPLERVPQRGVGREGGGWRGGGGAQPAGGAPPCWGSVRAGVCGYKKARPGPAGQARA